MKAALAVLLAAAILLCAEAVRAQQCENLCTFESLEGEGANRGKGSAIRGYEKQVCKGQQGRIERFPNVRSEMERAYESAKARGGSHAVYDMNSWPLDWLGCALRKGGGGYSSRGRMPWNKGLAVGAGSIFKPDASVPDQWRGGLPRSARLRQQGKVGQKRRILFGVPTECA